MLKKIKSILSVKAFIFIVALCILLMYGISSPNIQFHSQYNSDLEVGSNLSRTDSSKCATMDVYYKMIKEDPDFKRRQSELETFTQNYVKNIKPSDTGVVIIPVVVHIVYNTQIQNISNAVVQSQIDVLNEDFRRLNADTVNTPQPFKQLGGDSRIEFVLAKRDPIGNPSIGITRTPTSVVIFPANNTVKYTALGGHDIWDRDKYLNIWVCNSTFYGGYSQFPGGNPETDGCVIHYPIFGFYGNFLRGHLATHEIGHWFNLRHIWGDAFCGSDSVSDTPIQQTSNGYPCPNFPKITCNNGPYGEMFMNYMDNSQDICKNIFTIGQSNRMNAALNGMRSSLLISNGGVPVSGVPIAHFRSDNTIINFGQSINFFDESGGIPTSWQWIFEGGTPSSSNQQNPSVTYTNGGYYSVKLNVTNSYGMDSVNYVDYIKVGENISNFSLVYPPSNTLINTTSSDTSISVFTWTKSSLSPSVRYKWKLRRNGYPGGVNLNSNNDGADTLISIRNSFLDSIAMGFVGGSDTLSCFWFVYSYIGSDSLISHNQFTVYLIRHSQVGINTVSSSIPDEFKLNQNYPNPFNPNTKIRFALPKSLFARIVIYDLLGRVIETIVNEQLNAGTYEINWNAGKFSSGVYFYKLITNEHSYIKRMVLIK